VRVQHLLGHLEVFFWRHDQASLAHQRFRYEIGDIVRGVEFDHIVDRRRAGHAAGLDLEVERAPVAVRRRRKGHPGHVGSAAPLPARVAGQTQGRVASTVERVGQRDRLCLAREPLGQSHRAFDRLGAAVREEGLLELARGDLGQLLGQIGHHLHVVEIRAAVDQALHLLASGREHLLVAVTGVDYRDPGKTVDEAAAVLAVVGRAVGPVDHERINRRQEPRVHVLLVLLFRVHLSSSSRKGPRASRGPQSLLSSNSSTSPATSCSSSAELAVSAPFTCV